MRGLVVAAVVHAAVLGAATVRLAAQNPAQRIWEGVYTAVQAERGRSVYTTACIRCHGGDLSGTTAPPLTGERFMKVWGGESLERLFAKIRDTMPPNFGTVIPDDSKLDVVAYILQTGGFPAGPTEIRVGSELARIQLLRKGEQATVQNFSLVQAIGCLSRGENATWLLTKTADPSPTRDDVPPAGAIEAAASTPLGTHTFLLLSAFQFAPDAHVGQKMEARGLIYREPGDARITLTSLQPIGRCVQ
jgi:mono/diheme cytochrome c family protein